MKTIALWTGIIALTLGTTFAAYGHDGKHPEAPNPSPNASTSQEIGYTKVTINYGSPGVKDRTIWGELVPFDGGDPRPWVAGANGSTTIEFAEDVKVNGQALAAGKYGLHVIPAADEWTFIFNTDASRFGIMKYKGETDALRVTAKPEEASYREWLSYEIVKTGDLTGDVNLRWENVTAGFSVEGPDHREGEGDH